MERPTPEDRIADLEAQLAELRLANARIVDALAAAGEEPDDDTDRSGTSRRGLLRLVAAAAAGGAVYAVGDATPAAAADPNDLVMGALSTTLTRPTHGYYRGTAGSGSAFVFQSASTATPPYDGLTGPSATLSGWASGGRHLNGVYGYTVNPDGAGVLAIAEEGGTHAVRGIASGQATAVTAEAEDTAIRASTSGAYSTGISVYASGAESWGIRADGEETGVKAGATAGYGIRVCGGRAMILMTPDQKEPPPLRTDAHEAGELEMDKNFDLWLCTASGTPGTWTKLNQAPPTPGTAVPSFHPIDPVRVYDSRLGAGPLAPNTDRVVDVRDGRDATGAVVVPDAIPAGATAVTFNLTAAGPTGPNFVSVVPGDATGYTTSTVNFPGGFDAANGSVVKLDAERRVRIFCGDQAGSTHVIVDVTGYFA